jgi:L-serine dehydratase
MNVSVFEAIGPIMIGPSSSHTAGAAKLARIARVIAGKEFSHVSFGLHGSFAKTYKGHGTDRALVAGILGILEDDEDLVNSFEIAKIYDITFDFYELELEGMHENSVKITFFMKDGTYNDIIGSSIGGGQIIVKRINKFDTEITAQACTLVINQYDKKGVISDIARVLANNNINIGIMKVNRTAKGEMACCIIETDSIITSEVVESLKEVNNVISVHSIIITDK